MYVDLPSALGAARKELAAIRADLRDLRGALSKAVWHEQDHPRAEDGRFGDKPGEHGGAAADTVGRPRKSPRPAR
jgi:hypothetical protein